MMWVHHLGTLVSTLVHYQLLGGKHVIVGLFLGGNIPRKPNVLGEPQKSGGDQRCGSAWGPPVFPCFSTIPQKKMTSRREEIGRNWEEIIWDITKLKQENAVSRSSGQSHFQWHFMKTVPKHQLSSAQKSRILLIIRKRYKKKSHFFCSDTANPRAPDGSKDSALK